MEGFVPVRVLEKIMEALQEGRDLNEAELLEAREALSKAMGPEDRLEIGIPRIGFSSEGEVRFLRPGESVQAVLPPARGEYQSLSLGKLLRGVATGRWEGAEMERRALQEGTDALGGFLVPHPLSAKLIDLARNRSVCISAGAQTIPMPSSDLKFATVLQDPVACWRGEGEEITESDMSFGQVELKAKTLAALCRLSVELLEDGQNVEQVVTNALSQALALELDRAALFGLGPDTSDEPLGLYNYDNVIRVSMGDNGGVLENYAPLVEGIGAILTNNHPDHRQLAVVMNPREFATLNSFQDNLGQPLKPPLAYEEIGRKLISNQIPTNLTKGTANNASCIFIGDFREMAIGVRTELKLEVSRYSGDAFSKLQVLVRAYLRADVLITRPSWFSVLDGIIPPSGG